MAPRENLLETITTATVASQPSSKSSSILSPFTKCNITQGININQWQWFFQANPTCFNHLVHIIMSKLNDASWKQALKNNMQFSHQYMQAELTIIIYAALYYLYIHCLKEHNILKGNVSFTIDDNLEQFKS